MFKQDFNMYLILWCEILLAAWWEKGFLLYKNKWVKMLYDTLYDIAGDTSCSWQFYVFLVGSFLLSEIFPLVPRIGWSESLRQENLKCVFFCYHVSLDRGIHHSGQQDVWGNYRFPTISCISTVLYLRWFWYSRYNFYFFFNSILLFILFLDENAFQNFRLLHERKLQNFCQLEIHKTYNLLGYSWLICNFYTLFSVWVVKIEWHMVWILRYITFRAE